MEEDNSWVFDSLICFLNGPIWNAPLESFIEEKSLIFETNVTDSEEYRNIFDEFKNLVDFMLGNFMEDIGITPEQFEEACNKGHNYGVSFNHNIFEQIWAANDYEMFKRMMTQRNVELQLQALELIEQKYGITPQSFVPRKKDNSEDVEVSITIEKSTALEKEIMNEVAKNFTQEEEEEAASSSKDDIQYILEEKEVLEKSLKEAKEKVTQQEQAIAKLPEQPNQPASNDHVIPKKDSPKQEISAAEIKFDKRPIASEVDAVELKKRQEYLKSQRDKLVALKKEARKKQLESENGSKQKSKSRPKSAKAAEAVLGGDKSAIQPNQLQIRKALAERLKTEVVKM